MLRRFDGTDDLIRWGDGAWKGPSGDYTLGCLVKVTSDISSEQVLSSINLIPGTPGAATTVALGVDSSGEPFIEHDGYSGGATDRVTGDLLTDLGGVNLAGLHSLIGDFWLLLAAVYDSSSGEATVYAALPDFTFSLDWTDEINPAFPEHTGSVIAEVWAGGDQQNYNVSLANERPFGGDLAGVFLAEAALGLSDLDAMWNGGFASQDEWGSLLDHRWAFSQDSESDPCDDLIGDFDQLGLVGTEAVEDDPIVPYGDPDPDPEPDPEPDPDPEPAPTGLTRIRETPRLAISIMARTPTGKLHRWGEDGWHPEDRPTGVTFSSAMPGGHRQLSCSLPRLPGGDHSGLGRLTEIEALDAAGTVVWSGYLERAARMSGDRIEVTPEAVGWQAALEDEQGLNLLGVDASLERWSEPPLDVQDYLATNGIRRTGSWEVIEGVIRMGFDRLETHDIVQAWYHAPAGTGIARLIYSGAPEAGIEATVDWNIGTELQGAGGQDIHDWNGTDTGGVVSLDATGPRIRAALQVYWVGEAAGEGDWKYRFGDLCVVGDHGLPLYDGIDGLKGLLASDVITYALSRWAPQIKHSSDTIMASDFVLPVVMMEDTTVAGIVQDVNRFQLWDWACWGKEFHYHPRGARGRRWKARVGPTNQQDTGADVRRLVNGVRVHYTDVDGSSKVVGPPGDAVSSDLLADPDPLNEATMAGRRRIASIGLRGISVEKQAIQAGNLFWRLLKEADRSGTATVTGYIEDHAGVVWPHTSIRAGDTIEFVDASDPTPRRIVEVQHSRDARESTITLDAPPDAMEAVLDRLDAVLVGIG